jgi:ParB family transcriptional regulator, chromosome partitioning protein
LELKEPTFTVEQIAAKVGKTPAYITARLKLTDLCDDAAAAFYQESYLQNSAMSAEFQS